MTSSVEIDTAEPFGLFPLEEDPVSYILNLSPSLETALPGTIGGLTSLNLSNIPSLAKGILTCHFLY